MVFEWENDLFWIFWLAMFDYHKMYIYIYIQWIFPLNIVIFHNSVSLPEGIYILFHPQ